MRVLIAPIVLGMALALFTQGCCGLANKTSGPPERRIVSVYRTHQDADGYWWVDCYLFNVGKRPILLRNPILCDWMLLSESDRSEVCGAGSFWGFAPGSDWGQYVLLPNINGRDATLDNFTGQRGIHFSHRMEVSDTRVELAAYALSLELRGQFVEYPTSGEISWSAASSGPTPSN